MTTKFTKSDTVSTNNNLSKFKMGVMFYLQKAGKSISKILRLMEIPEFTVRSFLKRYAEQGRNIEMPLRAGI
jgi:predicted transcriptional regulator